MKRILLFLILLNLIASPPVFAQSYSVYTSSSFGTDNILIKTDGTAKKVQATGISIDDSNNITGIAGITATGVLNFGGATSFEVPNGTNPTTDAAGEIAVDTDHGAYGGIEIYGATGSAVLPTVHLITKTVYDPDGIQSTADAIPLFAVEAEAFEHGITLLDCGIKTNASSSYTVNFEEWTAPDDGSPSTIESVATSSSLEAEDDGTLTDAAIAAGSIIYADLPDTNIAMLVLWFTYIVNPGD